MKKLIDGKLYNTETANCIADNEFSDGTNRISHGHATYLYRTTKGAFFAMHTTCWQGEHDSIEPLALADARDLYEKLDGDADNYADYFGTPEEA